MKWPTKYVLACVTFFLCTLSYHIVKNFKYSPITGYDPKNQTLDINFDAYSQGLGNRLKYLVSYMRYYQPRKINLHWPNKHWVTARFFDLFTLDMPIEVKEYNPVIHRENKDRIKISPLYKYVKTWGLLVLASDYNAEEIPQLIDFKYNEVSPHLVNIYKYYFECIRPSDIVKKRISSVNLPANTVGVQVRNAPDWEKYYGHNENLDSFFKAMDKYPSNTTFYLSVMSKEVADIFYKKYPNRVIELPHKNYTSMVDAVADMYILGSTNELLCSYHSTFCEVSWWLGGAKSQVTVIGSSQNWKRTPDTTEIFSPN